eukprot:s739_g5.t2
MAHRTLITEPYRVADPFTSVRTCEHSDTLTIARATKLRSSAPLKSYRPSPIADYALATWLASHLTNIDQLLLAQFWPRVKICSSFHLLHRSLSLLWADFRGEENGLAGPLPSPSFQAIKIN